MATHSSSPEARSRAVTKHIKNNYDRIEIRYTKISEMKKTITEHAAKHNESVQAFIMRAIKETMENDNKKTQWRLRFCLLKKHSVK